MPRLVTGWSLEVRECRAKFLAHRKFIETIASARFDANINKGYQFGPLFAKHFRAAQRKSKNTYHPRRHRSGDAFGEVR